MPVAPEPKSRVISFRLTEREYADAEEVCRAQGHGSMALFARSAVLQLSGRNNTPEPGREELDSLAEALHLLTHSLRRFLTVAELRCAPKRRRR